MNSIITEYKEALARNLKKGEEAHQDGEGGLAVCRMIAAGVDTVIIDLFNNEASNFTGSLVAIGGYGRGLLNPRSDIDLLFLLTGRSGKEHRPPDGMLALLWDIGLSVGHSSRSIADTITVGLADITARTAMSECRLLAGNADLYGEFTRKYSRKVIRHRPNNYIVEKFEEMNRRRASHGRVTKLTEPNIKESPGGLRDFQTAFWALRTKSTITDLASLRLHNMAPAKELDQVEEAYSFLLRLRNGLHFHLAKGGDTLSHGYQATIARGEGFEGSDNVAAAQLMERYFLAAEKIKRFSDDMMAQAITYRKLWSFRSINKDNDGLFTDTEKLYATDFPPAEYGERPDLLFRIARRLSAERLTVAPNLFRGLKQLARKAPQNWFEGAEAGKTLLRILALPNAAPAMKTFHGAGILVRFIPEFAAITRLSQFDMYHRYATDEHTLITLRALESIPKSAAVGATLQNIYADQPDLAVIKLALLLHDLGKEAEDHHAIEEDTRSPIILRRLGLDEHLPTIGFLVREHLLMSNTAQRHDFTESATLRSFCEKVRSRDFLRRLYLLTYADIRAVGPDIWNNWKDNLLSDLYERAEKYFRHGDMAFDSREERMDTLVQQTLADPKNVFPQATVHDFISRAPERYLDMVNSSKIIGGMTLAERLDHSPIAIQTEANRGDATVKLRLAGIEKPGLFATVAGALTARNLNVINAHLHSFADGLVIDTLTVEGKNLSMLLDEGPLRSFEGEVIDYIAGKKDVEEAVLSRTRFMPRSTAMAAYHPERGAVKNHYSDADTLVELWAHEIEDERRPTDPHIVILNHLSETDTIIEIWAPDRLGLLFDETRTMARLDLDISSAKISTQGPRAINVFYVTTSAGRKIDDDAIPGVVEEILSAVVSPAGLG